MQGYNQQPSIFSSPWGQVAKLDTTPYNIQDQMDVQQPSS